MNTYAIVTAIDRADGITRHEKLAAICAMIRGLTEDEADEAALEEAQAAAEDCGYHCAPAVPLGEPS